MSFVRVGKVKDAHGIKGELFIVLFAGEAAWLDQLTELRLVKETADGKVDESCARSLPLKSARIHKNGLIAKTETLKDRNDAELLKGWLLEIPEEFFVSEEGDSIYLREIQGFKLFTKAKGEVGTIESFGTNGVQDLLVVQTNWGEFEIPFVEELVERIDYDAREVHMDLPEGLLGELEGDEVQ